MTEPAQERRLGYALVGTGAIAGKQAEALSQVPRARLVAVYNHTPEKARTLGERWDVPWTTSYDELLARRDVDVDPMERLDGPARCTVDPCHATTADRHRFTQRVAPARHRSDPRSPPRRRRGSQRR